MPYTLNLGLLDRAEYYSAGFPIFAGSIVNPAAVGAAGRRSLPRARARPHR